MVADVLKVGQSDSASDESKALLPQRTSRDFVRGTVDVFENEIV